VPFVHTVEINKIMIPLERCKKILNKEKYKYNEEEIRLIREYLYFIGQIEINNNKN